VHKPAVVILGLAMLLSAPARGAEFFGTGVNGGFFGTLSALATGSLTPPAVLLLEAGGDLLLENGGKVLLEGLPGFVLLENGTGDLLLETGGKLCLQGNTSC
jgi:hypothetical protein